MSIDHVKRRVWAEIDLDALEYNASLLRSQLSSGTKLCCVIKANAYGHGAPEIARLYEQLNMDFLAVSNIEEALQLRHANIHLPILILGYTPTPCVELLAEHALTQCVYSREYADLLSECAQRAGVELDVHIKLDTGMGRIGLRYHGDEQDAKTLDDIERICALPGLQAKGIFTHFASADEGEDGEECSRNQHTRFYEAVKRLEGRGVHFACKHCANSAALCDYTDMHMDMVRAGIVLYGLLPSQELRNGLALRPAMTLKSVISHIKTVTAGETISYGRTFVAERDMKIATVPIGYADGYLRSSAKGGAALLVRGKLCPVVGRVCMDQLMIDVSELPVVCMGDEVTVFGQSPALTAQQLAELNDTIAYEIICSVGVRVPRVYLRAGQVMHIEDHLLP